MRLEKAFAISIVSLLVIGISLAVAGADTLRDKVTVSLPHPVMVGDTALQPGEYTIQDIADTRIQITRNSAEVSPMTVEAEVVRRISTFNEPAKETKVALHRIGNEYYFDRIWMEGRGDYYEFVLPETAKSREPERKDSEILSARYEQVPADISAENAIRPSSPNVSN
jgi:hypothetical protein